VLRTRILLHHGQGLSGLQKTVSSAPERRILCHPGEGERQVQPTLFPSFRQAGWHPFRPDCHTLWFSFSSSLARPPSQDRVSRSSDREGLHFHHQQFSPARPYHRRSLQVPVAGRTVLQMVQATSPHQSFLWHLREHRPSPGMGGDLCLRPDRHRPQAGKPSSQPLHISTDSQCHAFRKKPHFSSVFGESVLLRNPRHTRRALFTGVFNRTVVIIHRARDWLTQHLRS